MLSEHEKDIISSCAEKYSVSSVVLFGSSTEQGNDAEDIDIAVKGLDKKLFFKFYAELFKNLSKPVDLIDLSRKSLLVDIIEETGVKIYG